MENNILILEESNLHQLAKLNLPMYSQILVTTSQQDGKIAVSVAKTLLTIQLQNQLDIQLLVNAAKTPNTSIFWAWLLGKLTITEPEAQITVLSDNSQEHKLLLELCSAEHPSVQILQVMSDSKKKPDVTTMVSSTTLPALDTHQEVTTIQPVEAVPDNIASLPRSIEPSSELLTDIHAVEPTEKRSEIAEMIKEKEDRKRKNEQMINALMKKVSELPYKIVESKPVSAFMNEQIIDPDQQILIN